MQRSRLGGQGRRKGEAGEGESATACFKSARASAPLGLPGALDEGARPVEHAVGTPGRARRALPRDERDPAAQACRPSPDCARGAHARTGDDQLDVEQVGQRCFDHAPLGAAPGRDRMPMILDCSLGSASHCAVRWRQSVEQGRGGLERARPRELLDAALRVQAQHFNEHIRRRKIVISRPVGKGELAERADDGRLIEPTRAGVIHERLVDHNHVHHRVPSSPNSLHPDQSDQGKMIQFPGRQH
jgi:hypothetical protein